MQADIMREIEEKLKDSSLASNLPTVSKKARSFKEIADCLMNQIEYLQKCGFFNL